jgi:hypothetical protein
MRGDYQGSSALQCLRGGKQTTSSRGGTREGKRNEIAKRGEDEGRKGRWLQSKDETRLFSHGTGMAGDVVCTEAAQL